MTFKRPLMAAAALVMLAAPAAARDQISIVGSSTVFPYTQAVAEEFASITGHPSPVVESTGTGGGFQNFCEGVGEATADITGASRAMKKSEYELCLKNGVVDITEALIGYDGLSVAVASDSAFISGDAVHGLTKVELFKALSATLIMEPGAEPVDNPYTKWNEINAELPDIDIRVYGPPPTSGTRDAFVELVMEAGCKELPAYEGVDSDACARMRQDGPFIEAGENDNLIVQRLVSDETAMGIFGYSFLYENIDKLSAVPINGVAPDAETIADGSYSISRPLFFYVKNAHRPIIAGLEEFLEEYVSEESLGPDGYLSERGLVVLPDQERETMREAVTNGISFKM